MSQERILLSPVFPRYTPSGEPNLTWAIEKYFIDISDTHKVNEDNRGLYISDYNNTICPAIDPRLPVVSYTDAEFDDLFKRILMGSNISEDTFSRRHRHLISDPLQWYFAAHPDVPDPTWGAFFKFKYDGPRDDAIMKVQRSFSDKEAALLREALLMHPESIPGEQVGLSICLYNGARLNEAAGVCFKDIRPLNEYPGEYAIRIGAVTTKLHSSDLKASGKTYNAPRMVPILDIHYQALIKRMNFISANLSFPIEDENGRFESVLDLPIVCRRNNYTTRCSADHISRAGRELFHEKLKFSENRMAGLSEIALHEKTEYTEDKSATSYTCRRDYATELENAVRNEKYHMTYLQYCMGHVIENGRFERSDLKDEYYLHLIKEHLENRHRVNRL